MSDLAATNCSCSNTDNGCGCSSILWIILLLCCCCGNGNGGSFFGGNDCGSGNNSCIWAIILLFCCGGFGCGGNSTACTAASVLLFRRSMALRVVSIWFCPAKPAPSAAPRLCSMRRTSAAVSRIRSAKRPRSWRTPR